MSHRERSARSLLRAALVAVALLAATGAHAQRSGAPDGTDLALAWARGAFASPAVCRFENEAQRGLRRLLITPGPATSEQRVDKLQFFDLGAAGAASCSDELGGEEVNAIGVLYFTYTPKRPRSDTPERDLKQDLERGPLVFEIVRGRLRMGPASAPIDALRDVDFAGGTVRLGPIDPGSDDARRIADLPGLRQLRLTVEAKDGTRIAMPLVEVERR